jgi:glucose/mannose transport system permease protein
LRFRAAYPLPSGAARNRSMRAGALPKLLLSPSVLLVLVCVYGYIMFTIYLSFTTSTLMPSYDWAGTANYGRLFALENWRVSLSNLWVFALLYIGIAIALGLGFAILIDQHIRAEGAFRSIFLYPMALSFIVTGTAWKWLLDPGVGLEHTLRDLGWESFTFGWIKDGDMAIYCVVIAAVWQTTGFVMALFLAGLRGVDAEQISAARVDGARSWQIYLYIVIPQLGPVFVSAFVILAHMAIKSYDLIIALTNGGPGRSTWLPSVFMYQYSFTRNEMAVGAASAVMMLAGIGLVVLPYLYSEMRKVRHG